MDDNYVELKFAEGHRISIRDRSILDVLGFHETPDKNRGGYFIGTNSNAQITSQPMKGEFPADITAGTNIFFTYCNIIEHQKVAGVKAPVLRVIDSKKKETLSSSIHLQLLINHSLNCSSRNWF